MIKPVFTEQTLKFAKMGKFTFRVPMHMTKFGIKNQIAALFGVVVDSVSTINYKATTGKNSRGKIVTIPAYKKAIVSLKGDGHIDLWGPKEKSKDKKAESGKKVNKKEVKKEAKPSKSKKSEK